MSRLVATIQVEYETPPDGCGSSQAKIARDEQDRAECDPFGFLQDLRESGDATMTFRASVSPCFYSIDGKPVAGVPL